MEVSTLFSSDRTALLVLFFLSFVYFLENFDRSLISVSPIPYIDYGSYEYSILAGPAFTIVYTMGGVVFALLSFVHQPLNGSTNTNYMAMGKFYILSLTTLIFSGAFLATAFALYFWQQVLIRIVMGLAQSIITPFSTSIISEYFPPAMRGSAFGIFNSGTYFSFSLSLSLGIFIYVELGWQAGYIIFGLIGIACSMIMPVFSCFQRRPGDTVENDIDASKLQQDQAQHSMLHTDVSVTVTETSSSYSLPNSDSPGIVHRKAHVEKVDNAIHGSSASETESESDGIAIKSVWRRMLAVVYDIVFVHWRAQPGIYMLCLATGVRIGAGYVWSAYTGAFFSDLFDTEDTSCDFSYNNSLETLPSNVCDSDYPYCVDGECSKLTSFPWHNKGMDSMHLVEYMAWVPIVGSAFGNVLGGFVSDYFIGKNHKQATDNAEKEGLLAQLISSPTAAEDTGFDHDHSSKQGNKGLHSPRHNSPSAGQSNSGGCGGDSDDSSGSGADAGMPVDQSLRMLIAGVSNLLPAPLIVCALLADFPYCFLIMIVSGMMGEMYMGQALATITDATVTPPECLTPAVAIFMFVITIIGGNMPLLIPLVSGIVGFNGQVDICFQAASVYTTQTEAPVNEDFTVRHQDARQLQYSMICVLVGCYVLSGVMYLISFWQIRSSHRVPR